MSPGDRRDGNLCSLGGHGDGRELTGGFTQRYLRQFGLCGHLWDSKAEAEWGSSNWTSSPFGKRKGDAGEAGRGVEI